MESQPQNPEFRYIPENFTQVLLDIVALEDVMFT